MNGWIVYNLSVYKVDDYFTEADFNIMKGSNLKLVPTDLKHVLIPLIIILFQTLFY